MASSCMSSELPFICPSALRLGLLSIYFLKIVVIAHNLQVHNPSSNLCLDTLNNDEKTAYNIGLYFCHEITAYNQVLVITVFLCPLQMKFECRTKQNFLIFSGMDIMHFQILIFCI